MHRSRLRWLLPPDTDRWIGYHDGSEAAEVWPDGLCGNQIAHWKWKLNNAKVTGAVPGTGNDDVDKRAAQYVADAVYFLQG